MTQNTALEPSPAHQSDHLLMTRQQRLEHWLQQVFTERFVLNSLPGDASARRYHRMQLLKADTKIACHIVMDSVDEQDALRQFITVSKLMSLAINVPTLIAQDVAQGFLVLQDFGTVEFADLLANASSTQVDGYYQQAMQTLIALQGIPVQTAKDQYQLPDYDATLLSQEMDLFRDWFLGYLDVPLSKMLWDTLKSALIAAILAQPQVIVHRDYHSRNLMQDQADTSRLGVIDFQDAVVGAYSYDLVSLIRDAYIEWPETQVTKWIQDFWQLQRQAGIVTATDVEQFENDVNVMGVQRHLKVLGIFVRLSERDGKDRYLADIPKVMRDLRLELNWLSEYGNEQTKQAVKPFNQWLVDTVSPAYQEKFAQLYK